MLFGYPNAEKRLSFLERGGAQSPGRAPSSANSYRGNWARAGNRDRTPRHPPWQDEEVFREVPGRLRSRVYVRTRDNSACSRRGFAQRILSNGLRAREVAFARVSRLNNALLLVLGRVTGSESLLPGLWRTCRVLVAAAHGSRDAFGGRGGVAAGRVG